MNVIPASKRRREYETSTENGFLRSLRSMIERPQARHGKTLQLDSDASDEIPKTIQAEKEGTSKFHLARAVDKSLILGGFGGLQSWIESNPTCRMLTPTEYRYEVKNLPPFEDHEAEVWQRWCVCDTSTNECRFEVPATRGDHFRPLLVAFTDECGSQIALLQGLMHGAGLRMWHFPDPFHRIWNDTKLALQDAGLWPDVYERLHCENLPTGPFKTAS